MVDHHTEEALDAEAERKRSVDDTGGYITALAEPPGIERHEDGSQADGRKSDRWSVVGKRAKFSRLVRQAMAHLGFVGDAWTAIESWLDLLLKETWQPNAGGYSRGWGINDLPGASADLCEELYTRALESGDSQGASVFAELRINFGNLQDSALHAVLTGDYCVLPAQCGRPKDLSQTFSALAEEFNALAEEDARSARETPGAPEPLMVWIEDPAEGSELGRFVLGDGKSGDQDDKFSNAGTRAGVALGAPAGTQPLRFFLQSLVRDLLTNDPDDRLLRVTQAGIIRPTAIRLACSTVSSYCLRLSQKATEEQHGYDGQRPAAYSAVSKQYHPQLLGRSGHAAAPVRAAGDEAGTLPAAAAATAAANPIDREALYQAARAKHPEWAQRKFAEWCRQEGLKPKEVQQWRKKSQRHDKPGALRYPDSSPRALAIVTALQK
jgi:hypothetical protein